MDRIEETLKAVVPAPEPADLLRGRDGEPLKRGLLVAAADHGTRPGDYARFRHPSTAAVVKDFYSGEMPVARLASRLHTPVMLADFGVSDCPKRPDGCWAESVSVSVTSARGAYDITERAAMSREAALECLALGAIAAKRFIEAHSVEILGCAAIGLGGEVSSTAMAAVVAGKSVDEVIDVNRRGSRELADAVQCALRRQAPDALDAIDLLAGYGGLETGALAGAVLVAAELGLPVVLDGLASLAAATVAVDLAPASRGYLVASSGLSGRASVAFLEHLGLRPLLGFDLPLDDGSSALLGMELAEICQGIATDWHVG